MKSNAFYEPYLEYKPSGVANGLAMCQRTGAWYSLGVLADSKNALGERRPTRFSKASLVCGMATCIHLTGLS